MTNGKPILFATRQRLLYYLVWASVLLLLSSIRSAPVYGKLDFLLVDNKPWWPEWEPVIIDFLQQGDKPLLTDPTTSAVFSGVFHQRTQYFREFLPLPLIEVTEFNRMSRCHTIAPPILYYLLVGRDSQPGYRVSEVKDGADRSESTIIEMDRNETKNSCPYRCLINLHGFEATWVPSETRHWLPILAHTSVWYRLGNKVEGSLRRELENTSLPNCTVFY